MQNNVSPRSKKLAMLQQKSFGDEESKSDNENNVRMGGRMGHQIKKINA